MNTFRPGFFYHCKSDVEVTFVDTQSQHDAAIRAGRNIIHYDQLPSGIVEIDRHRGTYILVNRGSMLDSATGFGTRVLEPRALTEKFLRDGWIYSIDSQPQFPTWNCSFIR